MWGRMASCGRLVIGLLLAVRKDPRLMALRLRLAAMWGRMASRMASCGRLAIGRRQGDAKIARLDDGRKMKVKRILD